MNDRPLLVHGFYKAVWAQKQTARLRQVMDDYISDGGAKLENRFDEESRLYSLVLETELLPLEVAMLAGDIAHNLRSALDAAISTLVAEAQGGTFDGRVNFPVFEKEEHFHNSFRGKSPHAIIAKLLPDLADLLANTIKPWVTGIDGSRGTADLVGLSRLDNLNKHNTIIIATGAVTFAGYDFHAPGMSQQSCAFTIYPGDQLPIGTSPMPIHTQPGVTFAELNIAHGQPFGGCALFGLLDHLTELTFRVLHTLEAHFGRSKAAEG